MDSENEKPSPETLLLEKALRELGEHFDSVQIFATRAEHDGTLNWQSGRGNFFARYGQVRQWLLMEEETPRIAARKSEE